MHPLALDTTLPMFFSTAVEQMWFNSISWICTQCVHLFMQLFLGNSFVCLVVYMHLIFQGYFFLVKVFYPLSFLVIMNMPGLLLFLFNMIFLFLSLYCFLFKSHLLSGLCVLLFTLFPLVIWKLCALLLFF